VTERVYLEDIGADERIILKWVFMKNDDGALNSFIQPRIGVRGLL
jgi:hypothetical protein